MRSPCVSILLVVSSEIGLGSVLYDNTILTNAGTGLSASQFIVQFDDVLVPSARNPFNLPLAITKVTVGVDGPPGTASFSLWTADVQLDGTPFGPPILIGTQSITFATSQQDLTFGDGSSTLFTVSPNLTAQPGFQLFYVGLSTPVLGPAVGWAWADGPDANLATAFLFNGVANTYFLNVSPPAFPPHFSFSLKIEGVPVPEPATWIFGLFGLMMLVLLAARPGRPLHDRIRPNKGIGV